jgi:predicted ArsR family transcriptional regulator
MLVREEDLPSKGTQLRKVYDVLMTHEYMGRAAIADKSGIPEDRLWPAIFTDLRRVGLIEWKVGARNGANGRTPKLYRRTKQLTPERVRKKTKRTATTVRQDIAACFARLQTLSDELEERIKDELLEKMRSL